MKNRLFTLSEVSAILGVKPYRIAYALMTKKADEPMRCSGRRMFNHRDVERLAKVLGVSLVAEGSGHEE